MQNSKFILLTVLIALSSCLPFKQKDKQLRIGLIDSYFCPVQGVHTAISATGQSSAFGTPAECANYKANPKKFHGQLVLIEILKKLATLKSESNKQKLKPLFIPVNIFDAKGRQTLGSWSKAIKILKEKRVQIIVSASGAFNKDLSKLLDDDLLKVDITYILSSGNKVYPIDADTYLWPQHYINENNGLLIGHYVVPKYKPDDGKIYGYLDSSLKYQEKVSFLMSDDKTGDLAMSSLAVAKFAAATIEHCHQEILERSTKKIIDCLKLKSKPLTILNSKTVINSKSDSLKVFRTF